MDTLSKILNALQLEANIYLHSEFCAPWSTEADHPGRSPFHVIAFGNCWLHIQDQDPIPLNAGDVIFFPNNIYHRITHDIDHATPATSDSSSTTLICGYFEFKRFSSNPILNSLPELIHIKAQDVKRYPWLDIAVQNIVSEAEQSLEGKQALLDKFSEILLIMILRYHLNSTTTTQGVMAGLADPQLSKALIAFHERPADSWSVIDFAKISNMSRAAFSEKFSNLIGLSPMQYVTFWRMQNALEALQNTQDNILSIALDVGYQSEAAFSKAFKKHFNISPSHARKAK